MTGLRWGCATDTGLVRTINQDHLFASATLFAVADGMGGHVAGEVASEVAIKELRRAFEEGASEAKPTGDHLVAAVRQANEAVYERAQGDSALRGMGTTMTAAALVEEDGETRLAIANVGDSRTYVFTHSELTQLTEDHSVAEELVRQGQLDPEEVDTHPQRHILTRAMGIQPNIEVDLWEILPLAGDRLLLCSDGLVREVTDDQIASVLRRLGDPVEAAKELVARARAGGGSDNISVVIVDVVDDDDAAKRASAAVHGQTTMQTRALQAEALEESMPAVPPADAVTKVRTDTVTFPKARGWQNTMRVVAFVIVLGGVLGGAGVAVVAYARGSYFVILGPAHRPTTPTTVGAVATDALNEPDKRPLLVFQGRPGGLLWFQPTLAQDPHVSAGDVCTKLHKDELSKGHVVSSLSDALRYIRSLTDEAANENCRASATTTTTLGATTTTAVTRTTTTGP